MFQLQIQWEKQGDWEDTVHCPRAYHKAFQLWDEHVARCPEHGYRLVGVTGYKV